MSTTGNNVFAKQDQRPYSLHKHGPKKNKYYYYPRQNVYYDPISSVYFVWDRTYWKPISHLPGRYVSVTYSNSPRFELWIASEHPYYYNQQHRRTYYEYRVVQPATARIHVESRPKPNVSFHLEIDSAPQPVYVEERYVIVKERRHDNGHHYGHHHGKGHGHGRGHGKGHKH